MDSIMRFFVSYAALVIGSVAVAMLLGVAWRLFKADRVESQKSASRAPSLMAALLGRTRVQDDTMPDARVQAGMSFNKKEHRLEISGRLGKESLDHIFQR
jgi:hypothetical protein